MKNVSKTIYIIVTIITTLLLLTSCQSNNSEIEALKKENEQLKQQIEKLTKEEPTKESDMALEKTDASEFNVKFEDDGKPMTFGNSEHIAEIKNASVIYSSNLNEYLLKIDFHYTNKSNDSDNFINDLYCNVKAYQNGIELDTPGITSEKDIYDTNNAYKNIKEAEIDAQLAFVLNNTNSDIELELGNDYDSFLITKKIVISEK